MSSPIEITIESLGGLGDGIATYNGKPLFVSKTCAGDRLRVAITEDKAQGSRAEIIDILSPGPARADAACLHYNDCGGCSLMHFSESAYREFKQRNFDSSLRQAGYHDTKAEIVYLHPATRRRVEFKFNGERLSYYKQRSHTLVPVDDCLILAPALRTLVAPLAERLAALDFKNAIKTVSITAADSGIDLLLEMNYWSEDYTTPLNALAKHLKLARISIRHTVDERIVVAVELSPVEMKLGNYPIPLPPDAFLQAAREGQKILTDTILQSVVPESAVADLFCGIGTYSFPVSRQARVHAIESDAAMIGSLRTAIKRHGLGQVITAERRDLFKQPLTPKELARFSTVIVNPPRIGAKKQAEELAASKVATVVMISCNPATWARDAKTLKAGGFALKTALGIDQFVYSPHFEIASVFQRN